MALRPVHASGRCKLVFSSAIARMCIFVWTTTANCRSFGTFAY